MTDADALLAAIRANPDDDLPRLVYADWMEENGHPAFAAFIRESIERVGDPPHGWPPHWKVLRAAYPKAFEYHSWRPDAFPRGICRADVAVPCVAFIKASADWWPDVTPSEVHVSDPEVWWRDLPHVPLLSNLTGFGLAPLREFDVSSDEWVNRPMRPVILREMIRSPLLGNVRRFTVGSIRATWAVLLALRNSDLADRLDWLHIDVRFPGEREIPLQAIRAANKPTIREQIDAYLDTYRDRLSTAD